MTSAKFSSTWFHSILIIRVHETDRNEHKCSWTTDFLSRITKVSYFLTRVKNHFSEKRRFICEKQHFRTFYTPKSLSDCTIKLSLFHPNFNFQRHEWSIFKHCSASSLQQRRDIEMHQSSLSFGTIFLALFIYEDCETNCGGGKGLWRMFLSGHFEEIETPVLL